MACCAQRYHVLFKSLFPVPHQGLSMDDGPA
jgi:hypothetical protein